MPQRYSGNRREFLTGKSGQNEIPGEIEGSRDQAPPSAGATVRLSQRAMACDFSVIMNAGVPKHRIENASCALDLVSALERQMSVYRDDSELTQINRSASDQAQSVEPGLYTLLQEANRIYRVTDGAFDPTSGPLVALWRTCRNESRIPTQSEISEQMQRVGMQHVHFSDAAGTIQFDRPDVELNLGAIGKGYALDRAAEMLSQEGIADFLLHGGHSSILACGDHNGSGGWPVGIGNPLFTGRRLGTILLDGQAMATSGSNIQYFRHRGKKYGHILDPRTGWPVESMLSVTVLASTAAAADALSTAFYVMGVESVLKCCDSLEDVGVILIPTPTGRSLTPIVRGIAREKLFLDPSQLSVT